jgi:hypothetical protein
MLFGVFPCGIVLVLGRLQVMTESDPGMVRGPLVIARFVVLGGFAMMFGGVLVVLRRMFVMFVDLVLGHVFSPGRRTASPNSITHKDSKTH